jgi:serine/threonine protein kinase
MENIKNRVLIMNAIYDGMDFLPRKMGKNCFSRDGIPKNEYDLANVLNIIGRIGSESRFGEVYKVALKSDPNIIFALKLIPVSNKENTKFDWTVKEVFKEAKILGKLNKFIEENKCPNLPIGYEVFVCNSCQYVNQELVNRNAPKQCAIIANEIADNDLTHWRKVKHSSLEWKSCIFQSLAGLTCIEEELGMLHNDLHDGNLLMNSIQKGGFWHYKFIIGEKKEENYYVPNTGQLWKLWDFGQSAKLKLTKPYVYRSFEKMMEEDIDYHIGMVIMEPPTKGENFARIPFSKEDEDQVYGALDAVYKISRKMTVPAYEVLRNLHWFTEKPENSEIINYKFPYTMKLKEY